MMKKVFKVMMLLVTVATITTGLSSKVHAQSSLTEIEIAASKIKSNFIEEYQEMTSFEKEKQLKQISRKYKAGDKLSEKDSSVIILNSIEFNNQPVLMWGESDKWFDEYKTQYGVRVNFFGRMRQDIVAGAGNSTYGGLATLSVLSGNVKNVDLEIHHTAYGIVGTSAPFVGVIYNGSVSTSKKGNDQFTRMDKDTRYGSILPAYTTMYASATVTNSSDDSFTVMSDTWKRTQ